MGRSLKMAYYASRNDDAIVIKSHKLHLLKKFLSMQPSFEREKSKRAHALARSGKLKYWIN